jgi:methylphosphotriester-DNA--protein-cysteine methyltransferase
MTEHETVPRARRRGKRGIKNKLCTRDGCDRTSTTRKPGSQRSCSAMCRLIGIELRQAERVFQATGDTAHRAAAAALRDALSEYLASESRVDDAAISVGFTAESWDAIKQGE